MTEWKRPFGACDETEERYRAGYQHGAQRVRELLEANGQLDIQKLVHWIEIDLAQWRHTPCAEPWPPEPT